MKRACFSISSRETDSLSSAAASSSTQVELEHSFQHAECSSNPIGKTSVTAVKICSNRSMRQSLQETTILCQAASQTTGILCKMQGSAGFPAIWLGTRRNKARSPRIFPSAGVARNPCLKSKLRKICDGKIKSRKIDSRKMSAFCILHSLQRNEWRKRLQRLFCIFLQYMFLPHQS